MYSNRYGSPELTNNPFITDPTNAHSRFPDIAGQSQWTQHSSSGTSPGSMYEQQLYQQQLQQAQQQQQYSSYGQQLGYLNPGLSHGIAPQPTGAPFQPTSSFGQQLAANISGTSYGYLQGQNGVQQQQQVYRPAQQQLQSPTYIAQFDPYASIGQGWGETQPQYQYQKQNQGQMQIQNGGSPSVTSRSTTSMSASGNPHPREYLRTHKAEIEAWDTYAWKQLLNSFEALKVSWEARTKELGDKVGQLQVQLQYGGGGYYAGQIQQEGARLQGLQREAQSHSDSVAASSFQMHEVFQGYRQSSDQASKRRVREASNAALQGLPDWPPQVY